MVARGKASTWIRVALSLGFGAAFLIWSAERLPLWPESWHLPSPIALVAAALLFVPYAAVRAARLGPLVDPLVHGEGRRFDRRGLYGSGFVSFLVLLVLPLKLGELSRPLLLARRKQQGVGLPESIAAVATERLIDGVLICGLLFAGLAVEAPARAGAADAELLGRGMLGLFACGLGALWLIARAPERVERFTLRVFGARGPGAHASTFIARISHALQPLLDPQVRRRVLGLAVLYWGITVVQLALVLYAVGLPLGLPAAATIVAIVGLSIQLPGGPAQLGTFQAGMVMALGLFVTPELFSGPGATFAATMYLLQTGGTALFALVGLWLLRHPSSRG